MTIIKDIYFSQYCNMHNIAFHACKLYPKIFLKIYLKRIERDKENKSKQQDIKKCKIGKTKQTEQT